MSDEYIHRRKMIDGKKYWIESVSGVQYEKSWMNCLYLYFAKEDFPQIVSPPLKDNDTFRKGEKRFDYYASPLNDIDFHGGVTFYEELIDVETGRTLVKIGCDYQHFGDDHYRMKDSGKQILENDGPKIIADFESLLVRLSEKATEPA